MNDDVPVLDELERRLTAACYGRQPGADARPAARRTRPRLAWAVAGLSAAALAVLAIVLASGSVEPSAAQALDRAATAAARTTATVLRPGEYWYTRTIDSMSLPVPIPPKVIAPGAPVRSLATVTTDVRQLPLISAPAAGADQRWKRHHGVWQERIPLPAGAVLDPASLLVRRSLPASDSRPGKPGKPVLRCELTAD